MVWLKLTIVMMGMWKFVETVLKWKILNNLPNVLRHIKPRRILDVDGVFIFLFGSSIILSKRRGNYEKENFEK